MTSHFVRSSIPSRYISLSKLGIARFIISLLIVVQILLVRQPMQTDANAANSSQESKEVRQIEYGKPIERELAGDKSHFYQMELSKGQYLNLVVEQKGIDVVVILTAPDGKQLIEMDTPNGSSGSEEIRAIIEADGAYQLEIRSLEKDAKAGKYEVRIADLRMATEQDRAWVEARKLHEDSARLSWQRKYDEALPLAERSAAIIEKAFGSEDYKMALALDNISGINHQKQNYAKVEALQLRVLAILEKTRGTEHPDVAIALTNLGRVSMMSADLERAEQFFQRALSIREKAFGLEHRQVAISTGDLAVLFYEKEDHAKAEFFYLRSLAILEKILGLEHPQVAETLDNLASLYRARGVYTKAESLNQRALSIFKKSYGEESPDVALTYNNLATLHTNMGNHAEAEALHQRALAIFEKTLGPNHIWVLLSLTNLAPHYERKGDVAKAEQLYQRAISIGEKRFGPNHPDATGPMTRLANLYERKGDYNKSETLLLRVLEIVESKYGSDHNSVASALGNIAQVYLDQGKTRQAIPLLVRSLDIIEHNLGRNILVGSERQKSIYLSTFNSIVNDAISVHVLQAPNDVQALQLAFKTILITKGRSLDAMSDAFGSLRRRGTAKDQDVLDKLSKTLSQLATLTFRGPGNSPPAEFRKKLDELKEQAEKLEEEISARNIGFYPQTHSLSFSELQSIIPKDTALVEFALYTPFDWKTKKSLSQRYVAYALSSKGDSYWVELGEAAAINGAVETWRKSLGSPSSSQAKVKQQARELDEVIMRPIRKLIGHARQIFISPDGTLNLIPFAALVDENDQYLGEKYSINYLTNGRDLLRLQVARESKSSPLVVADPIYGEKPNAKVTGEQMARNDDLLAGIRFDPLLTGPEADAIKILMPDSEVVKRDKATEAMIKQAHAPRILHIATHGFFLQNLGAGDVGSGNSRGFSLLGLPATRSGASSDAIVGQIQNPLLRAGLALAGANKRQSGEDDGILTALEVAGLDLWGTKLVVLSACDTGIGVIKNGEGVYGMRRALVLAGAESQVVSLWKVSDLATKDLMIEYYKGLKRGEGRAEALRNVQLKMLRDPRRRHPYYWASFIHSGEWANLDGKR